MYRVIYYNSLNIVTDKKFDNVTDARAFAETCDWARVVSFTESRTIVDVTTP